MNRADQRRSGVGRADLLRALADVRDACESAHVATLLGYAADLSSGAPVAPAAGLFGAATDVDFHAVTSFREALPPAGADERRGRFLRQTAAWAREERVAEAPPQEDPVTAAEVRAPIERSTPRIPALQPWSRVGPYLRRVLGETVEGRQLDTQQAVGVLSRLRPVQRLPRRRWNIWAGRAVVFVDCGPDSVLYRTDIEAVLRRLMTERGRAGLLVDRLREPPTSVGALPRGAPVLVISDLGRLRDDAAATRAWLDLGFALQRRGNPVAALLPCPRDRWSARQAAVWPSAVWDRGVALPRARIGLRPQSAADAESRRRESAKMLLALLSPAFRIEPGMVRALRWLLPAESADVGTEHDAWSHPHVASNGLAAAFRRDAAADHRRALARLPAPLIAEAAAILCAWHKLFSAAFLDDVLRQLKLTRRSLLAPAIRIGGTQRKKDETC